MSVSLTLLIRGFIGAFNLLKPSEVIVRVAASSNINALLGRWTSLDVSIGPEVGLLFPLHSFKATGRQLDVGVLPARLLLLLITLVTGNPWVLLLNLFISSKASDSRREPCSVDWTLNLSSQNLNGYILKPFMQSVLESLMKNSVLTPTLLSRQALSSNSGIVSARRLEFLLYRVEARDGGVEFDSSATYTESINCMEEMSLNFKLKAKLECDDVGGNGFMFTEPGIRTDFTEVIENTLAQVRSPIGKSILRRIIPKDPITYIPVGATVVFSLPCRVTKARVTKQNRVELSGRVDLNRRKSNMEGVFDVTNKLKLSLPTSF